MMAIIVCTSFIDHSLSHPVSTPVTTLYVSTCVVCGECLLQHKGQLQTHCTYLKVLDEEVDCAVSTGSVSRPRVEVGEKGGHLMRVARSHHLN